jgi:hypothetical protein
LDISDSSGKALFICRAGCDQSDVASEIGRRIRDNHPSFARKFTDRNSETTLKFSDALLRQHEAALSAAVENRTKGIGEFLFQRSISPQVARELRLGFTPKRYFGSSSCPKGCAKCGKYPALAIPRFFNGQLIGVKFRNLDPPDDGHKWAQVKESKADLLFGIELPSVNDRGSVLILEGELEVALARSHGLNAVAICGVSAVPQREPTERFAESLRLLQGKYPDIVLVGDNDRAGQEAMDRLRCLLPGRRRARFPDGVKDLGEFFAQSSDAEAFKTSVQGLIEKAVQPLDEPLDEPIPPADARDCRSEETGVDEPEIDLEMPETAMYGRLGEMARATHMPLGLAYPALLGCYSALPDADDVAGVRVNLYVGLLAVVNGGKNQAIERALRSLRVPKANVKRTVPVSDRGLIKLLRDLPKALLVNNEMRDVFNKTHVQNSTLASTFCGLWDTNEAGAADRSGTEEVSCRLSWVGGIPIKLDAPDESVGMFGRETGNGLYSRMIFGYTAKKFNYRPWTPQHIPGESLFISTGDGPLDTAPEPTGPELVWSAEAEEMIESWNLDDEQLGRYKFNLRRVAVLSALANGDIVITPECAAAALEFAKWQHLVKSVFRIGNAIEGSLEAKFCDVALSALQRQGADKQCVSWNRLSHDRKWVKTYGAGLVNRCFEQMVKAGEIILDPRDEKRVMILPQ